MNPAKLLTAKSNLTLMLGLPWLVLQYGGCFQVQIILLEETT